MLLAFEFFLGGTLGAIVSSPDDDTLLIPGGVLPALPFLLFLTCVMVGSLGITMAVATAMESTSTASTVSLGTFCFFLSSGFLLDKCGDGGGFLADPGPELPEEEPEPNKFGMFTCRVGNFISGLDIAEDASTPDMSAAGL